MNSQEREDTYTLPTYQHIRFPLSLVRGEGNWVIDDAGHGYLDLYGGHAVCLLGHGHPQWVAAVERQLSAFVFYSNTVYCPIRAEAAEWVVTHSYPSMVSAYFCNSGAEANETALKIARKKTGRPLVIAMERGFHGRTIGALSVTGFPKMRNAFPENVDQFTRFVPFGDLEALETVPPEDVAAVIIEPIQSVAGIYVATPQYYRHLRAYCERHSIVLIFDEVQTASGRTGTWCCGTHWSVEPDIVTTAKGLGGGLPVGAVIANRSVAQDVRPGDQATTFGGGPLAAAAVAATYRILEEEGWVERVARQSQIVIQRLEALKDRGVRDVRGLGYLLGVECNLPAKEVQRRLMDEMILVGTSGEPNTFRLLPPLTVTDAEWDQFFVALEKVLE